MAVAILESIVWVLVNLASIEEGERTMRFLRKLKNVIIGILSMIAILGIITGAGVMSDGGYAKGGIILFASFTWIILVVHANCGFCRFE